MRHKTQQDSTCKPISAVSQHAGESHLNKLPSRFRRVARIVMLLSVVFVGGCGESFITSQPSNSPPSITMYSLGMPHDFSVSGNNPNGVVHRRIRSDTTPIILAQADDNISGVMSLDLIASADTECTEGSYGGFPSTHRTTDLSRYVFGRVLQNGKVVSGLIAETEFNINDLIQCPSNYYWKAVTITLLARAWNYSKKEAQTATVTILHEFDVKNEEFLTVGTFNIANDHTYCYDPGSILNPNPSYSDQLCKTLFQHWGQTLTSQADVVLLSEVKSDDEVKAMAQAAGYKYWYTPPWDLLHQNIEIGGDYTYANTAVISRCPILQGPSPTYLALGGYTSQDKTAVVAVDCFPDVPLPYHDIGDIIFIYANHWRSGSCAPQCQIDDANAIAAQVKGESGPVADPVFVGGDLNTANETTPLDILDNSGLIDSLTAVTGQPDIKHPGHHCPAKPGDHILSNQVYVAYQYEMDCNGTSIAPGGSPMWPPDCLTAYDTCPSDHPFVLARFELSF